MHRRPARSVEGWKKSLMKVAVLLAGNPRYSRTSDIFYPFLFLYAASALVPRTSASAGCPCAVFTIVRLARPPGDLGQAAARKEVRSHSLFFILHALIIPWISRVFSCWKDISTTGYGIRSRIIIACYLQIILMNGAALRADGIA